MYTEFNSDLVARVCIAHWWQHQVSLLVLVLQLTRTYICVTWASTLMMPSIILNISVTVWLVIFARYLFSRFSWVKSHSRKLKPRKFCCPSVKRTNRVLIPGLLLYSGAANKSMSASVPLMAIAEMLRKHRRTIQTAAQGREQKQSLQVPDSSIVKIKTTKISETGILTYFAKFVPAKITNHSVIECFSYTNTSGSNMFR